MVTLKLVGPKFVLWVVVSNIFYFHPYLGKIPILTNIFQMGWNHQLVLNPRVNPIPPIISGGGKGGYGMGMGMNYPGGFWVCESNEGGGVSVPSWKSSVTFWTPQKSRTPQFFMGGGAKKKSCTVQQPMFFFCFPSEISSGSSTGASWFV